MVVGRAPLPQATIAGAMGTTITISTTVGEATVEKGAAEAAMAAEVEAATEMSRARAITSPR